MRENIGVDQAEGQFSEEVDSGKTIVTMEIDHVDSRVQERLSHQLDAISTDDGGLQEPSNMNDQRCIRTPLAIYKIKFIVDVDPKWRDQPWGRLKIF